MGGQIILAAIDQLVRHKVVKKPGEDWFYVSACSGMIYALLKPHSGQVIKE